jgi:hypothetical protein
MNRNTRKGLGAILAGVGMTTLLGVMSGTGVVRATTADEGFPQDPPAGDGTAAETEAEVTMKERCIWYVSGVASAITLTADDPAAVYDGDQYPLSATLDDYVAWTSGNTSGAGDPDAHAACTFFGDKTGISVDGLWSGNDFTAEAQTSPGIYEAEATMNFVAADADSLTMVIAEDDCRAEGDWSVASGIVASSTPESTPILTLLLEDATERPVDDPLFNDKCNADMSVTASIPTGKTPAFAGKPYKFTGPTFTTEILIDTTPNT